MTNPLAVALFRAALSALLAGATAFLGIWSQSDDPKTLAIAFLVPFVSVIASRGFGEGGFDARTKPFMNVPPATNFDDPPART